MESSGGGTHSFCTAAMSYEAPTAKSASAAHPSKSWERARGVRPGGWPGDSMTGPLLVTSVPSTGDVIRCFIRCDHAAIHASWDSSQSSCTFGTADGARDG